MLVETNHAERLLVLARIDRVGHEKGIVDVSVAVLMGVFTGHHEVGAVLDKGTSNGTGTLRETVSDVRWVFGRRKGEGGGGFKSLWTPHADEITMPGVRAGLGDDIDGGAGSASVFGGGCIGDDGEFLHGRKGDTGEDVLASPTIVGGGVIDGESGLAASVAIH